MMKSGNRALKMLGRSFRLLVGYEHPSCPSKEPLGFMKSYDLQTQYKVLCDPCLVYFYESQQCNIRCGFVRG